MSFFKLAPMAARWIANGQGRFCVPDGGTFIQQPLTTYKTPPPRTPKIAPLAPTTPSLVSDDTKSMDSTTVPEPTIQPVTTPDHMALFVESLVSQQFGVIANSLKTSWLLFISENTGVPEYDKLSDLRRHLKELEWRIDLAQEEILKQIHD